MFTSSLPQEQSSVWKPLVSVVKICYTASSPDQTARSPVYSHISMTIQGLSTIRAFGKQDITTQYYHKYMNSLSQAAYLYLVTNRWFGIRIDLLSAVLLACVAYASVPLASSKGTYPPILSNPSLPPLQRSVLASSLSGLRILLPSQACSSTVSG